MPVCYANPTPLYGPAMRLIASISQANPASIVTTFNHGYLTGLIVRFDIPFANGMQQLAGKTFAITVTSPNSFTVPVDSTKFDAFSIPVGLSPQVDICAQVVPMAELTGQLTEAVRNIING